MFQKKGNQLTTRGMWRAWKKRGNYIYIF
jgi:hypothetical protein